MVTQVGSHAVRWSDSQRPRFGPAAVFPVPRQRLVIIGPEADHPVVSTMKRIADKLGWPYLVLTDRNQWVWAITVNKPALVVAAGRTGRSGPLDDVAELRRSYKGPIAVVDDLPAQLAVSAVVAGADTVLRPDLCDDELGARLLALVRRTAEAPNRVPGI